jgi:integrase/recombinase XerD
MPRTPSLKPRPTDKGWELTLPATQSETGKRQRLYFKSEKAAKIEAAKRKRLMKQHGAKALHIPADIAAQALKASAIVEKYDVTLVEVARDWVARREQQAASITLGDAWCKGEVYRSTRRPATIADYKRIGRKLPAWLMKKLVSDITRDDCEKALAEVANGASTYNRYLRNLRATFSDSIRDGYSSDNPASKVRKREQAVREVAIVTVDQLGAIFSACIDYRIDGVYDRTDGLDCRPCAIPFAFLAFAGLRPQELVRLTWEDVSLELSNIRLRSAMTKTRTLRNVHIEDNLRAWIETLPEPLRTGQIVPGDWNRRRALVSKKAGLAGAQDILRHSYGSFYLAAFDNLDALNANMGHAHIKTFFDHYHNSLTKRDALPYWSIGPIGWYAERLKTA